MMTTLPRLIVALFALTFVVAACASDSGAGWTYAPVTAPETEAEVSTAEPEQPAEQPAETAPAEQPTGAPAETPAEPEASAAAVESAEPLPAGEARVIEVQADSALRFTDANGQPLADIAVTPGETVRFEVNNTAGFAHNFWIGTEAELTVPNGATDVGIPDWTTGVEVIEWVVPEDVSDLKFACTVPGHYYTMQGTFSAGEPAAEPAEVPAEPEPTEAPAEAPAEPEASAAAVESAEPEQSAEPATASGGEPRIIELEADPAIRFLQEGTQIRDIAVTPGETVIFRIENTAGFAHNFYIGADEELSVPNGKTETGLPDWNTGVQELEWVVPEDVSNLRFACTVPGHYYTMQGDFTVSP